MAMSLKFGMGMESVASGMRALAITGTPATTGQEGWYTSFQTTASGGAPAYTYSNPSATLPTGLTVNASTGLVSGTSTTAGTYTGVIRVTDSATATANLAFSIIVATSAAGYQSEPSRASRTPV